MLLNSYPKLQLFFLSIDLRSFCWIDEKNVVASSRFCQDNLERKYLTWPTCMKRMRTRNSFEASCLTVIQVMIFEQSQAYFLLSLRPTNIYYYEYKMSVTLFSNF